VCDWLRGLVPRRGSSQTGSPSSCAVCDPDRQVERPETYVYLLGLYLGDGCISAHPRNVFRLRIALDTKYPAIISSTEAAMREVRAGTVYRQRRPGKWVEVSSYWKHWPCHFPQLGPGPKHAREIRLAEWQQVLVDRWPRELLKGLIHSDGHRFMNTGSGHWICPRYAFTQVSTDIQNIFCEACDRLAIHWTRSGERIIYISRKADVARLDTFIGPKA
jgi:hypothetical protein